MDIGLSADPLDIAFHPRENTALLATGLISGKVQLFTYGSWLESGAADSSSKSYKRLWSVRPSRKSCRGVYFSLDGSTLYAISKDRSLIGLDPESSVEKQRWSGAHECV